MNLIIISNSLMDLFDLSPGFLNPSLYLQFGTDAFSYHSHLLAIYLLLFVIVILGLIILS